MFAAYLDNLDFLDTLKLWKVPIYFFDYSASFTWVLQQVLPTMWPLKHPLMCSGLLFSLWIVWCLQKIRIYVGFMSVDWLFDSMVCIATKYTWIELFLFNINTWFNMWWVVEFKNRLVDCLRLAYLIELNKIETNGYLLFVPRCWSNSNHICHKGYLNPSKKSLEGNWIDRGIKRRSLRLILLFVLQFLCLRWFLRHSFLFTSRILINHCLRGIL